MTTMELLCTSCHTRITNQPGTVKFTCPNCSKSEIIRCPHCRKVAIKYTCPSCNFTGAN